MKQSFQNKLIWITGASSGIGRALAIAFHAEGANVILSARNTKDLLETQRQCIGTGSTWILPMDMTNPTSITENVNLVLARYASVDCLIHNAGIAAKDLAVNTSTDVDRNVMETNYWGPVTLTRALLPSMLGSRCGHIVAVSSLAGKYGVPTLSGYAASKHALHGFFDSLRAEVYKHDIRVTTLVLGFVDTEITVKASKGDGSCYAKKPIAHVQGWTAERCAAEMLTAIRNKKEEAVIGGMETLTVLIRRLSPAVLNRMMRNHPVQQLEKVKRLVGFYAAPIAFAPKNKHLRPQAL